jgi:hypothetical protein
MPIGLKFAQSCHPGRGAVVILLGTENPRSNPVTASGVDVMIAIFCDFCQFLAKNLAFLSKTNVMVKFLQKTSSSLNKKNR